MMRTGSGLALSAILAHFVVVLLHGAAHRHLEVPLSKAQNGFVWTVIVLAPLLAGALLVAKQFRAGAILLAASMSGALVFGAYFHFVADSPDHILRVARIAIGGWAAAFQATSVLLAITEAVGCWAGVATLRSGRPPVK